MYIGFYEIKKEAKDKHGYTKIYFKSIEKEGVKKDINPEIFADSVLKIVKTREPTDFNFVRNERCQLITKDILAVFLKYNIKISEIEYMVSLLQTSLQDSVDHADEKLWKVDSFNRTIMDVHNILLN